MSPPPPERAPEARRRPTSPASPAGVVDAFRYAATGGALAAVVALSLLRLPAYGLPFLTPFLHLLLWLALYKYALEILARSGEGSDEPPDVLGGIDSSVHHSHLAVQLLVLVGLSIVIVFAPDWQLQAIIGFALVLPGLILSLTVAQNLSAAINPGNWVIVATKLGIGYPLLALAWGALLWLQISGTLWTGWMPKIPAVVVFYTVTHYLTLVLFRWMGRFLFLHARALGLQPPTHQKPELAKDKERKQVAGEVLAAREIKDPAKRAAALREAVERGGDDSVHEAYREALRTAGQREELGRHARVRTSQLTALKRFDAALLLAREALDDDAAFTLSNGDEVTALVDGIGAHKHARMAVQLIGNYRRLHPKRRDGLALALRAAHLHADLLGEREVATNLLAEAMVQAEGDPGRCQEIQRLQQRLEHGLPLASFARPGTADGS